MENNEIPTTHKPDGHKVHCTNGRKPIGWQVPADKCRECNR